MDGFPRGVSTLVGFVKPRHLLQSYDVRVGTPTPVYIQELRQIERCFPADQ